ncbi:MAG: (deoxy)nucleoside triphosphate pyrophosphohydrolase [Bacteroidota bacterium]
MKTVTAAIIIDDDKILIAQRSSDATLPLKWEFPGGKVEDRETPEECLSREIMEELDLVVSIGDFFVSSIYKYEFGEIELLAYFAKILSGNLCLNVHVDHKWVLPKDLSLFDFAPADIEIVQKLQLLFM